MTKYIIIPIGGVEGVIAVREAAVAGIGRTAFSKCSGRTPLTMAAEAVRAALDHAGLRPSDVVTVASRVVHTSTGLF